MFQKEIMVVLVTNSMVQMVGISINLKCFLRRRAKLSAHINEVNCFGLEIAMGLILP